MSTFEIVPSRDADVGGVRVRRALPRARRRMIGPWCFVDHMGPIATTTGFDVAPHPHMGLQTVTWLLAGEALHRDSLGSEQVIRPGELNLMTAGSGVAHSEERVGRDSKVVHGVQLWVAQPDATRHGAAAFEHHRSLPQIELGAGTATVLVGAFQGSASLARRDTEHVGLDLALRRGRVTVPLRVDFEHALVVLDGSVLVDGAGMVPGGTALVPGALGDLGIGRDVVTMEVDEGARVLLIGGIPFELPVAMWWNFVGRDHQELSRAVRDWNDRDERFGTVRSELARIASPVPPW